jgi:hypothetical protein
VPESKQTALLAWETCHRQWAGSRLRAGKTGAMSPQGQARSGREKILLRQNLFLTKSPLRHNKNRPEGRFFGIKNGVPYRYSVGSSPIFFLDDGIATVFH